MSAAGGEVSEAVRFAMDACDADGVLCTTGKSFATAAADAAAFFALNGEVVFGIESGAKDGAAVVTTLVLLAIDPAAFTSA